MREHKGAKEKLAAYQTLAAKYELNGVWTEALETSATGRSGGVAMLARGPVLVVGGHGRYGRRRVRAVMPCARTRAMACGKEAVSIARKQIAQTATT